jgi:hypothetical protein
VSSTGTYVRAGLPEVATALAVLTGEPHPLARKEQVPTPMAPRNPLMREITRHRYGELPGTVC